MAPIAVTPESSGTTTPVAAQASTLTQAGIKHHVHDGDNLAPLDASKMIVTLNTSPREVPAMNSPEVMAQKTCTDHMVTAAWDEKTGWAAPELKPYGPFSIMPSASVLHYATECFEGLKLYRGYDDKLRLFRVNKNCERMRRSCERIALPDFDAKELEKMIIALCARDGPKWLPSDRKGSFLYIRPTMISTDPALGVQRPKEALLYVIIALFPDMSKSLATPAAPPALKGDAEEKKKGTSGLKLLASTEDTIRAWPGGFGYAKLGANYGPSLVAQGEARARGFDQVLWLFGMFEERYTIDRGQDANVTEAGASNFFVVWRNKETKKVELITAPLGERIILEGVTRASILELARSRLAEGKTPGSLESVEVIERKFTMADIIEAHEEGRLLEAFAAGTAFFVAPVGLIHYKNKDIEIPTGDGESGDYAKVLKGWLGGIMYGKETHEWGVVVDEVEA